MSKVKRGLQLSAAIVSIVFNAILIISSIYVITLLNSSGYGYYFADFIAIYVGIILFCIANIVICSLLCINPDKKYDKKVLSMKMGMPVPANSEAKGLTITALVLSGVLALLYLIGESLWVLLPLVSVGLFIAVLCMPRKPQEKAIQTTMNITTNMDNVQQSDSAYNFSDPAIAKEVTQDTRKEVIRQAVENIEKKTSSGIDDNIARIRRLHQDGVLSADEMKQLIMEELKKQK